MILTIPVGVVCRPLTCPAAWSGIGPGCAVAPGCRGPWGRAGRGPGLGWSGRPGWWPAGGLEQVLPFGLAVPAERQVQGQAAAAGACGPGGDVDQVPADGRAPGAGVRLGGQAPGGADQVAGHG